MAQSVKCLTCRREAQSSYPHLLCQMVFTFLLAVVGWIIFRAETMRQAWNYMICMVTKFHICMPEYGKKTLVYIFILLIVEWLQREKQFGLQLELKGMFRYRTVRWGIYYLLFIVSLVLAGQQEEFIYFQF